MQSKTKIPRVPQTSIQKKHTRRSMQLHSNKLLCSGVLVVHCEYCEILREEISKAGHQGALFSHPTHLCRNNLLLLSRHGSSCINQLFPSLPIPQPPLNTAREAGAYLGLFVFFWMGGLVKLLWPDWGKCTFCKKKENQDDFNKRCSSFLRAAQSLCDLAAGLRNIFTSKYNVFCF